MTTFAPRTIPILVLTLAVLAPARAGAQVLCLDEADDIAALQLFERSVNTYAELHRRLEFPLSARHISSDPEAIASETTSLAAAIRAARPGAKRGEIFVPEVADLLRFRLANTAAAHEYVWTVLAAIDEDTPPVPVPYVNHPVPWASSSLVWPAILRALPTPPPELEYRFVNRDLVLIDVDTNLVVDVLDEALPVD